VAKQLFSNGASATLAVTIVDSDVTVQVQSGYGVLFPSPTGGDYFVLTLEDNAANIEVMHCTARSGDLLTVTRAQEGTPAQGFTNTVTRCELRDTKGTMERFLQRAGDTLGGNLELGGHTLSGPGAIGNDVTFPLTLAFSVGMIMLWSGSIGTIPAGWALCNGTGGTPDLRNRFIVGAGSTYAVDATGGALTDTATSAAGGAHTHTLTITGTALTTAQLPSHTHALYVQASGGAGDTESFASTAAIAGNTDGTKGYLSANSAGAGTALMQGAGSGDTHTHAGSTADASATHTHDVTVDTVPPYYALAYIMFTG
jgi:microcystin-dependent protein